MRVVVRSIQSKIFLFDEAYVFSSARARIFVEFFSSEREKSAVSWV